MKIILTQVLLYDQVIATNRGSPTSVLVPCVGRLAVMARWRSEALKRLPEMRTAINAAPEVMALWIELCSSFERAYEQRPLNESLISRIYSYADWCLQAPRGPDAGHDPFTAVIVAFHEDIPRCQPARDDMPRWFRYEDVAQNKPIFSYHLGEDRFNVLLEYMKAHRDKYVPRTSCEP